MSVLAALVKRFEVDVDSEVPKMLVSGERVEWLSKSSTIPGATFIKSLWAVTEFYVLTNFRLLHYKRYPYRRVRSLTLFPTSTVEVYGTDSDRGSIIVYDKAPKGARFIKKPGFMTVGTPGMAWKVCGDAASGGETIRSVISNLTPTTDTPHLLYAQSRSSSAQSDQTSATG